MAMPATRPWFGKRALEAAILFYRRRISGRGPLCRVTCTFGGCESCSAYGLRMVRQHAESLPHAVSLIVGRIRRCRTSSVYRDERALMWGEDYDRLEQVDPSAAAVHERPSTRRALLTAAIGLARYRGERRIIPRLLGRLRTLPRPRVLAKIPLRNGRRLLEHLRGRWLKNLAAPLLLGVVALVLPMPLAITLGTVALLLAGQSTRRFFTERQRFHRQRRLAHFALA